MKQFKNSLFLFSRDLRIQDNSGLIQACKESEKVIPCFIFDQNIISEKNSIYSKYRTQFLLESINDLRLQFKKKKSTLHLFYGAIEKIVPELIKNFKIDSIFTNLDYSPHGVKRQKKFINLTNLKKIPIYFIHDLLLQEVNTVKTEKGEPYVIFSQFFKKAKNFPVKSPQKNNFTNFENTIDSKEIELEHIEKKCQIDMKNKARVPGGRRNALKILKNLSKMKNYQRDRNFPALDSTTHLSAHNKFGTCSIREAYYEISNQLDSEHTLISELYWRDFFTCIMHHFPYSFSKPFRKKYEKLPWSTNKKLFQKWCDGNTGFPIVDAGIRELNHTGYMHNRVRMIVASFLTKDLHINWKWGERYFAKKLVDYDPCVNVGNWQWAASTGCDAQPWFRIFNPWLQQERYDPKCEYIKRWIPELKEFGAAIIHKWNTFEGSSKYSKPIISHSDEVYHAKEMFKKIPA